MKTNLKIIRIPDTLTTIDHGIRTVTRIADIAVKLHRNGSVSYRRDEGGGPWNHIPPAAPDSYPSASLLYGMQENGLTQKEFYKIIKCYKLTPALFGS